MNTEQQLAALKRLVAEAYGVDPLDLDTMKKPARLSEARNVAIYLMRELLKLSLPAIADTFKRKDHGSAIWSLKAVRGRLDADPNFRSTVEALSANVRAALNLTNP